MFYLTTHSTHFIYGYMASYPCSNLFSGIRQEGNFLFNDALNTFYFTVICSNLFSGIDRKEMFYLTTHSTHLLTVICSNFFSGIDRKEMFYLTTHSTHFILRLYGKKTNSLTIKFDLQAPSQKS